MDTIPWLGLILAVLPLLGKFLLGVPFVSNKAIPFILYAFNLVLKYWLLLGFPTAAPASDDGLATGAIFAWSMPWDKIGLAIWAVVEQYFAHRFYEGKKAEARLKGEVSWWEQGKDNWWRVH